MRQNHFAQNQQHAAMQQATLAPVEDKYFAGDQLIDPREVVGERVTTSLWRKDKRTGQMRPMQFAPNPQPGDIRFEFPKVLYPPCLGDGMDPVTVYDPDQEQQAIEMGYVDHPNKTVQMAGEQNGYDVAAVSGEQRPVDGSFTVNGKRRGRPPGSGVKRAQTGAAELAD